MAEIEIGGITFKGGKMLAVGMALSTAVGVLYGGFEVYKDYTDMKEQIQEYVAPDLSDINKTLAVLEESVNSQNTTILAQRTTIEALTQEIGAKTEALSTTTEVMRESINRIDGDLQGLFSDVRDTDKRLYELEKGTSKELSEIRKSIQDQIQEALENPLAGQ
jgi:DNA anti-recombination protein RmuC